MISSIEAAGFLRFLGGGVMCNALRFRNIAHNYPSNAVVQLYIEQSQLTREFRQRYKVLIDKLDHPGGRSASSSGLAHGMIDGRKCVKGIFIHTIQDKTSQHVVEDVWYSEPILQSWICISRHISLLPILDLTVCLQSSRPNLDSCR